jgi:hypothetical protein
MAALIKLMNASNNSFELIDQRRLVRRHRRLRSERFDQVLIGFGERHDFARSADLSH